MISPNCDRPSVPIFIVIVVEMAQVTPPVGFNLFVLQGMTRREIGFIARAAFPSSC
jgi:C4-dicarboxylate transporter DctM subunit